MKCTNAPAVAVVGGLCLWLALVLQHRGSNVNTTDARSALLGPCLDSTICSRYALMRSAGGQLPAPKAQGSASRRARSGEAAATGGFSFLDISGLVTAPAVAAEHLVQRETRGVLNEDEPSSSSPLKSANPTGKSQKQIDQSTAELPEFHISQVLHISTSQGRLPLIVDGKADASGDIPVHGFREGIRYEGFIRVGKKADGITYPPTSSILHAMYTIPRTERETNVHGLLADQEAVTGKLAIAPDNGIMTTINTRAMATPDGALAFNPNFVYGAPGTPRSIASTPLRAIIHRVDQQRRQDSASLRRRASARFGGARGRNPGKRSSADGSSSAAAADSISSAASNADENKGHTFHGRPYNSAEYEPAHDKGRGGDLSVGGDASLVKKAKEMKGFFDVSANHFASVNLSPVACPGAKMSASCGYSEMTCHQARGGTHSHTRAERWGAGVETQKNVREEIGGWGRVPFNEPYAPLLSTIYHGA